MWQELKVLTTKEAVDSVSAQLNLLGAKAVTLLPAEDQAIYEPIPGTMPLWQKVEIIGLFPDSMNQTRLVDYLLQLDDVIQVSADYLKEQQWERAWLDRYKPMCFADRLWVCPSDYTCPDPEGIVLRLDPGLAFGTGTHPTTSLCLAYLAKQDLTGQVVLDYGCGSGILAVAAMKLGCQQAYGVDIDPQAITASNDNAARNEMGAEQLQFMLVEALPKVKVDLLVANILAEPLIGLVETFAAYCKPHAKLILSGILSTQVETIEAVYDRYFAIQSVENMGEWALVEAELL